MDQERKNKILLGLLLVLVAACAIAFVMIREDDSLDINKDIFKVADLQSVDEVRFLGKKGSVHLKYNGSSWVVNEKYDADRNMIQVLFATLAQAQPKRALSGKLRDSIASILQLGGTKVELLAQGNEQKSFVAGGNANKTQGYFLDTDNNDVYVMTIPGYRVYVSGIFELTESGFRNKYAFPFNWENFKSLTTTYPAKASDNFTVGMRENYFSVGELSATDTTKLYNYLDDVARLTVDNFVDTLTTDTMRVKEVASVRIEDIAARKYLLQIFPPDGSARREGLLNGEPVIFSEKKIQPLLKGKFFFAKKNQ